MGNDPTSPLAGASSRIFSKACGNRAASLASLVFARCPSMTASLYGVVSNGTLLQIRLRLSGKSDELVSGPLAMAEGIRTALPMVLADELDVDRLRHHVLLPLVLLPAEVLEDAGAEDEARPEPEHEPKSAPGHRAWERTRSNHEFNAFAAICSCTSAAACLPDSCWQRGRRRTRRKGIGMW